MTFFVLTFLRLLHLLTDSASAQMVKDSMVAAAGSSIRFPGTDRGFSDFNWEFSDPSRTIPIMEYTKIHPIIFDQYRNRVEFNKSDGSLLLKDLQQADTGRYKLTVDLDPHRTRILTLEVFDPLSKPSISCNFSPENHTVALSCEVQRGRASSILWTRGGVALLADQRYWLSDGNTTLIIRNVQKSDSGTYTCTVTNPVSQTNNTCHLTITAQMVKDSMVAATGSSIRFPGTDKGFTEFNWEFSDSSRTVPIMEYTKKHHIIFEQYSNRVEFSKSNGSLLLKDLQQTDTGRYKLTVDLDPHRTRILTLEVFDPLSKPAISCNFSLENHTVALSCEVQRGRASSILWTRGGVVLPADQRYWLSDGNTTLIIRNAQKSDSGTYTCTVTNPVSQTNNTYHLTIMGHESSSRAHLGLIPFVLLLCVTVIAILVCARKPVSRLEGKRTKQVYEIHVHLCKWTSELL
uniref:cell adhesion molecule CEACAM1-like isoform X2 n=1 Tax=Pristiophorus japonicus TaxID=55135 RepID=UPI00398E5768